MEIITKKSLEEFLGYEIKEFEVDSIYIEGELQGLNIKVEPTRFIKSIETSVKINTTFKSSLYPVTIQGYEK